MGSCMATGLGPAGKAPQVGRSGSQKTLPDFFRAQGTWTCLARPHGHRVAPGPRRGANFRRQRTRLSGGLGSTSPGIAVLSKSFGSGNRPPQPFLRRRRRKRLSPSWASEKATLCPKRLSLAASGEAGAVEDPVGLKKRGLPSLEWAEDPFSFSPAPLASRFIFDSIECLNRIKR
jgi:hypothetical protein